MRLKAEMEEIADLRLVLLRACVLDSELYSIYQNGVFAIFFTNSFTHSHRRAQLRERNEQIAELQSRTPMTQVSLILHFCYISYVHS